MVIDDSQDANLLHAVLTHGTNWATIACSHCPKRTTLALRNRYSTLRLQNNNNNGNKANADASKKACQGLPSISENTVGTSRKKLDWNPEAARCSSWNENGGLAQSSDEDDGDEDEDEENEDEENDEEDNEDETFYQRSDTSCVKALPSPQRANDGSTRRIHTPDSHLMSWDTWATQNLSSANPVLFEAQPIPTDDPAVDRVNHVQCQTPLGRNSAAQYPTPGESYFYSNRRPGASSTSVQNSIYGRSPLLLLPIT